jgi:hypothetical protein
MSGMSAASQMVGADGLAIDGAVRESELAGLHVEERAWIERGRFALSGGGLRVRSGSGRRSLRRPLPRAGGGEQTAQARRLVFLRKALPFGIDGIKTRHRLSGRRRRAKAGQGSLAAACPGVRPP